MIILFLIFIAENVELYDDRSRDFLSLSQDLVERVEDLECQGPELLETRYCRYQTHLKKEVDVLDTPDDCLHI